MDRMLLEKLDALEQEVSNRALQRICSYLRMKPSDALRLNLDDFAQRVGVSRSSVLRLCNRIGLKGYKELQKQLVGSLSWAEAEASGDQSLQSVKEWSQQSVFDTFLNLSMDSLRHADSLFAQTERILWYGVGESGFFASIGNHKCHILGLDSRVCIEPSVFWRYHNMVHPKNVLIAISSSGSGDYLETPLNIAVTKEMPIIGVTSEADSFLYRQSQCTFVPSRRHFSVNHRDFDFRPGHEALINLLVIRAAMAKGVLDILEEGMELDITIGRSTEPQ